MLTGPKTDKTASVLNKIETNITVAQSPLMNEWMFNDTPARKTDRLLGVRKK